MIFINPIEILELQNLETSSIDNTIVKKAKRKLFAEIDLSDNGYMDYKGLVLSKTDCEKVIDDIENKILIEFYHHLASNHLLNDYLVSGREEIFSSFKQESIYKLPEFIKFVSPFFAEKFDKSLLKSFTDNKIDKFRTILRSQILININDLNNAYKSLSIEIQNRIEQIKNITSEIENGESEYDDENIEELIDLIRNKFPIELLNLLPTYFQSQINKIASSINYLGLTVWNEFNTTVVPLRLLEHILELNIESVGKPTFQKNYNIYKKKHEELEEIEANAPLLKKWATVLLTIQSQRKSVEEKTLNAKDAFLKAKALISITELNNLPSFANEIRTQIGYSLRSIAISAWNKQDDIISSCGLIDLALEINVSDEANIKFRQDKTELDEIAKKYKGVLVCYFCGTNPPDNNCSLSTTIYKENSRSYFPSRSVQFSYLPITIPRCKSCQEVHSKGNDIFYFIFFPLLIVGIIIGSLTEDQHFIIGGLIGAVVGLIVGKIVESNKISNEGIKDASNSTLATHPLIVDRINQGWTFSKPSA